jgi:hypothetical protein
MLKNGDWLLPVSLWTREKINPVRFREAPHDLDPICMAKVFASAHQRKTWTCRGGVAVPHSPQPLRSGGRHRVAVARRARLARL